MKNNIKKEQFNDLWDMYKIAHKIDIAWQDEVDKIKLYCCEI